MGYREDCIKDRWTRCGKRIERERKRVGLTQEKAAKRAGLSRRTWVRLETAEPGPNGMPTVPDQQTLERIAEALGVPLGVIDIPPVPPPPPLEENAVAIPGSGGHAWALNVPKSFLPQLVRQRLDAMEPIDILDVPPRDPDRPLPTPSEMITYKVKREDGSIGFLSI